MRIDGLETHVVMQGQGGGGHVEPGHGETVVAEFPSHRDGAIPVRLGARAVGNDRKMASEPPAFVPASAAQHFEAHRRTPLRLVDVEEALQSQAFVVFPAQGSCF